MVDNTRVFNCDCLPAMRELKDEILKIINHEIVLSNNDFPLRYAPEFAAEKITNLLKKMQNYERLIIEELSGSTPKEQYEYLKALQRDRINLYAKVEQAKTLCIGLLGTPGLENIKSIIEANYENLCKND